jgi:hypothetical protein
MAQPEQAGPQIEGVIVIREENGKEYILSAENLIDSAVRIGIDIGKTKGKLDVAKKLLRQNAREKMRESGYGSY